MRINYSKASKGVREAYATWIARDCSNVHQDMVSFFAGYNAALASLQPVTRENVGRVLILSVERNGIDIRAGGLAFGFARNYEELRALFQKKVSDNDTLMFSSSMDFPREYTSNRKVLDMVRRINKLAGRV